LNVEPELAGASGATPPALERGAGGIGSRLWRAWEGAPVLRFLLRRLASLALVVWVVEIATFLMVRIMPGDPAREVLGPHASAQAVAALRHQLGLDRPLLQEYFHYTSGAVQLNFGSSFFTHLPVSAELGSRVGPEIELVGLAVAAILVLGIAVGLGVGALTKEGRHPLVERLFVLATGVVGSVPGYVAATVFALLFAVTWQLLPVAGDSPADAVILPALSIALPQAALLARIVRVETLNVLAQNYVRSARSKRLSGWAIYSRYVLPNVMTAALTLGGTIFTQSIGSAIIVETVFAWPGLGLLLTQSVLRLDFPMIEGGALLLAVIVVVVNALVDIAVSLVDPRSAAQRGLELG
jgi:peptide/nickel transport system permease protein